MSWLYCTETALHREYRQPTAFHNRHSVGYEYVLWWGWGGGAYRMSLIQTGKRKYSGNWYFRSFSIPIYIKSIYSNRTFDNVRDIPYIKWKIKRMIHKVAFQSGDKDLARHVKRCYIMLNHAYAVSGACLCQIWRGTGWLAWNIRCDWNEENWSWLRFYWQLFRSCWSSWSAHICIWEESFRKMRVMS